MAQLIGNYKTWSLAGGTPGNGTSPPLPSLKPLACFEVLLRFPYNLYGLGICLTAFGLLIFMIMRMGFGDKGVHDKERNLVYSQKGTYGTSGFMPEEEMHQVLKLVANVANTRSIILGKLDGKAVCLPEDTKMNQNVAVYGASGSMKSRAYARNVIFQCVKRGESLIINDPKSELYEDMAGYLEDNGYMVRVFNLVNPKYSDSWNCLLEIGGAEDDESGDTEIMAQLFCDVNYQKYRFGKGGPFLG